MNTPLLVANWKMNLDLVSGTKLANDLLSVVKKNDAVQVVLCPPFTMLDQISKTIKGSSIKLGGQDCSFAESGAYTGDVSAAMLKDCGCDYIILGHSERRNHHNESESIIKQKAAAAHSHNLKTIICIGESVEERKHGRTLQILEQRLLGSIPLNFKDSNFIIAYEPLWSIGTGQTPTNKQIAEVMLFIHDLISERFLFETPPVILYGGSVTINNSTDILAIRHVGGLLVGKASLTSTEFGEIIKNACKQS